jgi:hypothetical protein
MLLALTETFDPAEKPCERKTLLLFAPECIMKNIPI